jgi:hypothetical protein
MNGSLLHDLAVRSVGQREYVSGNSFCKEAIDRSMNVGKNQLSQIKKTVENVTNGIGTQQKQ